MYNILICDDERDIVSALKIYLGSENYKIFESYNGREALDILENNEIHLVLLDIMMPVLDGISTLSYLREKCNVPVILLSAKSEDTDKILGLNIGADDYITKPFNPLEVIARVKSQLRRYTALGSAVTQSSRYVCGNIELDDERKTVTVDGEGVILTPHRIRNTPPAHPQSRQGVLYQGNLRPRLERGPSRNGEQGCGAYKASARKDRDQSRRSEIFESNLGQRV